MSAILLREFQNLEARSRYEWWKVEACVPSSEGLRGAILSGCAEVTAALPFEEDGVEGLELLIGLEYELEVEEL